MPLFLRRVLARHWPLVALLLAGAVLRAAAAWATSPALLLTGDSQDYLASARSFTPSLFHPFGYSLLLKLLWWTDDVRVVTVVQHLLGLGLGAGIYALLLRLGVGRPLATVAAAFVVLDAYQVNLERFILAEMLFVCLLVAAVGLLVASDPPPVAVCVASGLLLAGAGLTRTTGLVVLLPCLAMAVARRWPWRRVGAFVLAAVLPLIGYAMWFDAVHGRHRIRRSTGAGCTGGWPPSPAATASTSPRPSATFAIPVPSASARRGTSIPGTWRRRSTGCRSRRRAGSTAGCRRARRTTSPWPSPGGSSPASPSTTAAASWATWSVTSAPVARRRRPTGRSRHGSSDREPTRRGCT